jgi:heme exporter protein CcmD
MIAAMFAWGRYGAYVWPAYGITLAGIAAAVLLTWHSYRRAKARLADVDKGGAARPHEA